MVGTITATQVNVSITAYDATGQTGNARNFNGSDQTYTQV